LRAKIPIKKKKGKVLEKKDKRYNKKTFCIINFLDIQNILFHQENDRSRMK